MKVVIAGASGFIGRHLVRALAAAGHEVVCGSRATGKPADGPEKLIQMDFTAPAPERWARELSGVDVVINAVGILRESGQQTFEALHVNGPCALFNAAADAGVRRVIQISALGAGPDAIARYHRSKYAADRFLASLDVDWAIVRPSLVYGTGGTSARLFETLAAMPVIPVAAADAQVQPVHVDDVTAAVSALVQSPTVLRCVLSAVGPTPLSMVDFLVGLRSTLGLPRTATLRVPRGLLALSARLGDRLPGVLLDSETLGMLERGNTASASFMTQWLGREPLPLDRFVEPGERAARRTVARLAWMVPLLRISVAAMWLIAGLVSLGPYPVPQSLALLQSIGAPARLAPLLLMGAAAFDLLLGALTLLPRRPRWLWTAQILLIAFYTLVISIKLPGLWLEPFGPVAKNLPILAMLLLLREFDRR